ncbi:hypothetical protein GWO13_02705 [Candidatus Bathyarchaeota archaeon]|nr:hypothetical protein [Candidatus Bathyarchaeota archaeon]
MSKLFIRIELEGELAQIFESIREAHKLKTNNKLTQTLIHKDLRCFGNRIEIPISKKNYQQIWKLIRDFDLNYSSVEEFVQETFIKILKLTWKRMNQANKGTLKEKVLAYII